MSLVFSMHFTQDRRTLTPVSFLWFPWQDIDGHGITSQRRLFDDNGTGGGFMEGRKLADKMRTGKTGHTAGVGTGNGRHMGPEGRMECPQGKGGVRNGYEGCNYSDDWSTGRGRSRTRI